MKAVWADVSRLPTPVSLMLPLTTTVGTAGVGVGAEVVTVTVGADTVGAVMLAADGNEAAFAVA